MAGNGNCHFHCCPKSHNLLLGDISSTSFSQIPLSLPKTSAPRFYQQICGIAHSPCSKLPHFPFNPTFLSLPSDRQSRVIPQAVCRALTLALSVRNGSAASQFQPSAPQIVGPRGPICHRNNPFVAAGFEIKAPLFQPEPANAAGVFPQLLVPSISEASLHGGWDDNRASGAELGALRGSANWKLKARKKFLGLLAQEDIKLLAFSIINIKKGTSQP